MTPISPRTRGPASSTKPLQRSSISSYRARKPGQLQRVALIETQQRSADRRCPTSAYAPRPSVGDPPTRTTSGSARSRTVQLGLPARSLSSFGRAGPRYRIGDISITPMVASCDGPRDCFPVGEAAERACAMPRLRSRRRAAPDYRFDPWGVASPEHRNCDGAQLRDQAVFAADSAASKRTRPRKRKRRRR